MEGNRKNWFGRNWKWAVPTGGCLFIIILIVGFAGTLFFGLTKMFKESQPYEDSMATLLKNELVIEKLGEPIEENGMINGNFSFENSDGFADIKVPVKGPKGEAILHVTGTKKNDVWTYEVMTVTIKDTNEEIDLLPSLELKE